MAEEERVDLEWLQFHWNKWRQEANRFWKHLAFATVALLALSLYQMDVLQFNFSSAKLTVGANSLTIKRYLICPISLWLWFSILFCLVDFLRHRVPDQFEKFIHNNQYPVPGMRHAVDLKILGRTLYLILVLVYLVILGGWVIYCSVIVWK